jgi:hypothetical protein
LGFIKHCVSVKLRRTSTNGGFFIISSVFLLFLEVFSSELTIYVQKIDEVVGRTSLLFTMLIRVHQNIVSSETSGLVYVLEGRI